jgi:hypothetical protein
MFCFCRNESGHCVCASSAFFGLNLPVARRDQEGTSAVGRLVLKGEQRCYGIAAFLRRKTLALYVIWRNKAFPHLKSPIP